jgi:uncharacterized protein YabE (DUF348 family)/3D (Asp-Asp-Asp) domain-containing protein
LRIYEHFDLKKSLKKIGGISRRTARRFRDMEQERKEQIRRQIVSLALTVVFAAGSVVTVMASTRYASVTLDGKAEPVMEINSADTSAILKQAGVSAGAEDVVLRTDEEGGNIDLTVKTAKRVFVSADGSRQSVLTHYGDTAADALKKAGVTLGANDAVAPSQTAKVESGMEISVRRRYSVSITADGKTKDALVWEGTVSDTLSQAGITLGTQDTTDPDVGAAVTESMKIKIARVTYKDVTSTQPIAFTTTTRRDSSLDAGTKTVTTQGQAGVKTVVTHQKLCDGKVVQSSVTKTEVTRQPVSQVVSVGTKESGGGTASGASVGADGTLVDQNGSSVSYRRVFTGRCSGYCTGTTTSTGLPAAYGRVAVNPNLIPYGTKLYICSPDGGVVYGYAVAADTGGAAMSGRIVADLYFPSYSQCIDFGNRTMNVYVLG